MNLFSRMLWTIALRSILQHRTRSLLLGLSVAGVTAVLVMLTGAFVGMACSDLNGTAREATFTDFIYRPVHDATDRY